VRRRRPPHPLSANEQKLLLTLARDTLRLHLSGQNAPDLKKNTLTPSLKQPAGVFVTLKLKKEGALRGCIGYITGIKPRCLTNRIAIHK
jgi:AMMECR1 domain-containing protein